MPILGAAEQAYLNSGGTLTNGSIPTMSAPTGTSFKSPTLVPINNPVGTAIALNSNPAAPKPTTAVSPTTMSGDKSQQISENTQKVADLSSSRVSNQQSTGGLEMYSDGTPISAPTDAILQRDESGNTWWSSAGKNYALAPDQGLSPEEKSKKDIIEKAKAQTDAAFARQISAVQAQYDSFIKQQRDTNSRQEASVNQSLLMGGTSRYAGVNAAGINQGQISYGIQQVADLVAKENMAISQLESAQADKNYEFVGKELARLEDIKKAKQDAVKSLNEKLLEANKTLRQQTETRNNAIDNDIRAAILDAQKGGATPEQIKGMQDALTNHDYAGAIAAGGNSLSNASGIIGEYNFYVKNAKAAGQAPVDFNTYQNMDANRKAKVAAAGVPGASGYSNSTLTKVQQIAGQFDNEQVVKDFNNISQQIEAVKTAGESPTDDIQRIYAFAKVMDPNSVVRDTEYKTVQDYSQALFEKVGLKTKRIFDNDGFLTKEARNLMLTTLENRAKTTEKSYKNIYDEYGRRINKISGGSDGKEFLTDYSKGYGNTGNDIVQSEQQKTQNLEDSLTALKTSNPKLFSAASKMYTSVNTVTGMPYTVDEILQAFPELNN